MSTKSQICIVEELCAQHMVYSHILRCFVAESFFAIYAVLLHDRFVAIYVLLRGEKFDP